MAEAGQFSPEVLKPSQSVSGQGIKLKPSLVLPSYVRGEPTSSNLKPSLLKTDGTLKKALSGDGLLKDAAKRVLKATAFDGSQYGTIADNAALRPESDSYSVAIWFRAAQTVSLAYLFTKGNANSITEGVSVFIENNLLGVRCNADGTTAERASQTKAFTDTDSFHLSVLVIDRSGNAIKGYLDGVDTGWTAGGAGPSSDSIAGFSAIGNTTDLYVAQQLGGANRFLGEIESLKIFPGVALSSSQAADLYLRKSIGVAPGASYLMDGSEVDVSGNGHSLTFSGGPTVVKI